MKIGAGIFFAFLLGIGAALAGFAPASAQVDSRNLSAAREAAASFAERAKGSEKTEQMPRITDPAVKKLLDVIFDTSDIAATKTIPFEQLSPLSDRMLVGNQVGITYMLSGTGSTDLSQLANDAGAADKLNLNVVKYPDEMGRYLDFTVTIQGAIAAAAPKLKNFLLAEQKEELRKMAVAVADVTDDAPAKKTLQDFARAME